MVDVQFEKWHVKIKQHLDIHPEDLVAIVPCLLTYLVLTEVLAVPIKLPVATWLYLVSCDISRILK